MNEEVQNFEDSSPVFSKPFLLIRSKSELFEYQNFESPFLSEKLLNFSEEKGLFQEKNLEEFTVIIEKTNLFELDFIEEIYQEKVDFIELIGSVGKYARILYRDFPKNTDQSPSIPMNTSLPINPHQSTSMLANPHTNQEEINEENIEENAFFQKNQINQTINNEEKITQIYQKLQENLLEIHKNSEGNSEKGQETYKEIPFEEESTINLQKTQEYSEISDKTSEILNEKTQKKENSEIPQENPEILHETPEILYEKTQENPEILQTTQEILQNTEETFQNPEEILLEKPQVLFHEILQETPEILQEVHESSEESSLQNLSKYDSEVLAQTSSQSPYLEGFFTNNSLLNPQKISFEEESLEDFQTQKASFFSKLETIKNFEETEEKPVINDEECDFSEENERKLVVEPRIFIAASNEIKENAKETEDKSKKSQFFNEKKCETQEKLLKEGFLSKKSRNFLSGWQVFIYKFVFLM